MKESKNEQLEIITKEMNEIEIKVDSLKKVNEQLDEESETFLFETDIDPSKAPYFIAKATALKRKRNENKSEMEVLEKAILTTEEKCKKVNK